MHILNMHVDRNGRLVSFWLLKLARYPTIHEPLLLYTYLEPAPRFYLVTDLFMRGGRWQHCENAFIPFQA